MTTDTQPTPEPEGEPEEPTADTEGMGDPPPETEGGEQ